MSKQVDMPPVHRAFYDLLEKAVDKLERIEKAVTKPAAQPKTKAQDRETQ
jgi:hypothetical protein